MHRSCGDRADKKVMFNLEEPKLNYFCCNFDCYDYSLTSLWFIQNNWFWILEQNLMICENFDFSFLRFRSFRWNKFVVEAFRFAGKGAPDFFSRANAHSLQTKSRIKIWPKIFQFFAGYFIILKGVLDKGGKNVTGFFYFF